MPPIESLCITAADLRFTGTTSRSRIFFAAEQSARAFCLLFIFLSFAQLLAVHLAYPVVYLFFAHAPGRYLCSRWVTQVSTMGESRTVHGHDSMSRCHTQVYLAQSMRHTIDVPCSVSCHTTGVSRIVDVSQYHQFLTRQVWFAQSTRHTIGVSRAVYASPDRCVLHNLRVA